MSTTENTTNPADIPADIPGRPRANWESSYLDAREQQLEESSWYPKAVGQPGPMPNRRFKAFTNPDEGDFQASVSPQCWDCSMPIAVPQSGGAQGPVQVAEGMPGRAHLSIINTGNNPVILSPNPDRAMAGVGISVAANATFTIDCQGPIWAYGSGGSSTVQAYWTYWESPSSHLPPKDKD